MVSQLHQQFESDARSKLDGLQKNLLQTTERFRFSAEMPIFREIRFHQLTLDNANLHNAIRQLELYFLELQQDNSELKTVRYVDEKGIEVLRIEQSTIKQNLADLSQEHYIRKALELTHGEVSVTVSHNEDNEVIELIWWVSVFPSHKVRMGVLGFHISFDSLCDRVMSIGGLEKEYIRLEDEEGNTLFDTQIDRQHGKSLKEQWNVQGTLGVPGLSWKVVLSADPAVFLVDVAHLRWQVFVIILPVIILMLFIGIIFTTRQITERIKQLVRAAQMIGRGNLDYKIEVKKNDEIGQLHEAFNNMAIDLSKTTTSIDNLNEEIVVRKRAEDALKENEERLRIAMSAAEMGTWKWDVVTNQNFRDANFNHILGLEAAESIQRVEDFVERVHPEDRAAVDQKIKCSIRERDTYLAEFRIICPDGTEKWLRNQGLPFYDKQDKISYMTGVVVDITKHRIFEESVRSFAHIFEESLNEIYIFDAKTLKFINVNKGARQNLGYSMEELTTLTPLDFKPEFTAEVFAKVIEPLLVGEKQKVQFTTVHQRKDGSLYDVEVHLQLSTFQSVPVFVAIILDITDRKKIEDDLRASEENYRVLVSSVRDYAIFMITPEGIVNSWNEGVKAIKGYTADEIIGKHISIFYPEEDIKAGKIERELQKAKEDGEYEDEGWRIRKDGSRFWANVVFTALHDENGKLIGYTKVTRDFTDRKKAEDNLVKYRDHLENLVAERTRELEISHEKLMDSERLAVLGRLSGGIAHEIRNPLASIDILAINLKRKLKDADEKTKLQINQIIEQVKDSTDIIQGLQDLARLQEPNKDTFDIYNIIENGISVAMIPRTVEIVKNVAKEELFVDIDEKQITIVLRNILSNAVQAMDKKGTIWITACRGGDSWLNISIKDTGHGIEPENMKKIFESFFGTKVEGFGFGLTICKMIMEKHGGRIEAESEVGKGATFILSFSSADAGNYAV